MSEMKQPKKKNPEALMLEIKNYLQTVGISDILLRAISTIRFSKYVDEERDFIVTIEKGKIFIYITTGEKRNNACIIEASTNMLKIS